MNTAGCQWECYQKSKVKTLPFYYATAGRESGQGQEIRNPQAAPSRTSAF